MAIRFRCSECNQWLSITSQQAGATVWCPKCAEENVVPEFDEVTGEVKTGSATPAVDSREVLPEQQPAQQESEASVAHTGDDTGGREESGSPPPARQTDSDDEGLVLRSPQTELEDMDLTPMVDVTFLLLIFFMITASFSLQKSIEVPPPDPDEKGATQSVTMEDLLDTSVKVEIDEKNVIYVDEEKLSDPAGLADTLREKMDFDPELGRRTELFLVADARALHETVVTVIDAANEVGMQKIHLATK